MRYALYFTPAKDDALAVAAARWLGRDAFADEQIVQRGAGALTPEEVAFHTAAPRRYGFHATLKAPFELADTETEASLRGAFDRFAGGARAFIIPRLVITQMDGFFALVPAAPVAELNSFAADVVRHFDGFRAPLSEADIQRRNPDALKPQEVRNLVQWGYPYVFETFRFHMTLTGRVSAEEAPRVRAALDSVFQPLIEASIAVDGLALFVEPEPGAPFSVLRYRPLAPMVERKSA